MDGQRQLDFLFKDFNKQKIDNKSIIKVIEQTMLYALDFDLYIPPMDTMKEITVQEKDYFNNPRGFATGKRLGFKKN